MGSPLFSLSSDAHWARLLQIGRQKRLTLPYGYKRVRWAHIGEHEGLTMEKNNAKPAAASIEYR